MLISSIGWPTAHTSGLLISHGLLHTNNRDPSYTGYPISSAKSGVSEAQRAREGVFLKREVLSGEVDWLRTMKVGPESSKKV